MRPGTGSAASHQMVCALIEGHKGTNQRTSFMQAKNAGFGWHENLVFIGCLMVMA